MRPALKNQMQGGGIKEDTPNKKVLARREKVEKYMLAGMSLMQITQVRDKDDKPIGEYSTISRDMDYVKSIWLEKDPTWFNRARLARIEAGMRLKAQLTRLNILVIKKDGKAQVYAEAQLTNVISKLYEIESDFDPENFLDKRISEHIIAKVSKAKTTNG